MTDNGLSRPMTPEELVAAGYPANYHEMTPAEQQQVDAERAISQPVEGAPNPTPMDEVLAENPELAAAWGQAQQGQFEHTLLEQWEMVLQKELDNYSQPADIDTHTSFLANWPWLNYHDVEKVRKWLAQFTVDAINALNISIIDTIENTPKTKEDVYEAFENDWEENREIYLELIPRWTCITNVWHATWSSARAAEKPILHVAAAVSTARFFGEKGLVENLRWLKNTTITEEDDKQMKARLQILLIESGLISIAEKIDEEGDDD